MSFEQFKCLTADIAQAKKLNPTEMTPSWLENESLNGYKVFGLKGKNDSLSLSEFLIGVGQLKFRGTSVLFRLNKSLSDILIHMTRDLDDSSMQVESVNELQHHEKLHRVSSTYELATHTVKVKRSGTLVDITRLWDLEEATTPTAFKLKNDLFSLNITDDLSKPQFDRIQSIDFFNQCSQPNEMLTGLRYFERAIKSNNDSNSLAKESFSWGKVDMDTMGRCLIVICKNLQEIISMEDRLIHIPAPCYILGDY